MTRDEVRALMGKVDDHLAAEIIATGATPQELTEALAWVTNDEPLFNAGKPLASGRVNRIIEILEYAERVAPGAEPPEPE